MALPSDFNKIFGSTATGGLTPISDVNYAKGWEYVGGNPPTKNDFSYLQNMSDLKSKWLYDNNYGRLIGVVLMATSGTYIPSSGTKSIIVEAIGGGGASGNLTATGATENAISAAGSNGAYAKARYTSGFSSVAVTIGAGGAILGGGGGNGGDGGTTSFGSLMICPGGKGSRVGTAKTPPFNEGAAQPSAVPTGSGILISSKGPYSTWPTVVAVGNGSNFANSIGSPLGSYGLGGDGVFSNFSTAAQDGKAGASGCVMVWEYA